MGSQSYEQVDDAVILEKRRLLDFNVKLKKHLSEDMMYLTEKKDDCENRILQLKMENDKKDKILFQNMENIDVRKYFSPLNLSDSEDEKKDDEQNKLSGEMQRLYQNIEQIEIRLQHIKALLYEMDLIIDEAE